MLSSFMIGMVAAALAEHAESPLAADWLYNPLDRPVMVTITPREAVGTMKLALLTADGSEIANPVEIQPGWLDLAETLPDIWRLNQAAFLQLMVDEEPIGAALVLQPMLARMVPTTEDALSPNGTKYTRITGWRDELLPPPPPVESDEAEGGRDPEAADEIVPPGNDRLLTGLRIYPDRDVILHTTQGDIRLAMRPDHAPNTAWNFIKLCEGGFYRDIPFHRVVPLTRDGDPFVIQAGDPSGTGNGGPGYWLPIEPSGLTHDLGVISMARDADPDSAGSQFFICLSRKGTARLDGHYCAFGYAVAGRETILAIADVELADLAEGRPANPPVIQSVELLPAPPRAPGAGRPDQRIRVEAVPLPEKDPQSTGGRVPR